MKRHTTQKPDPSEAPNPTAAHGNCSTSDHLQRAQDAVALLDHVMLDSGPFDDDVRRGISCVLDVVAATLELAATEAGDHEAAAEKAVAR